jgi:hypothetical protein
MKTREEFEKALNYSEYFAPAEPSQNGTVGVLIFNSALIVELLLDIRDLLAEAKK